MFVQIRFFCPGRKVNNLANIVPYVSTMHKFDKISSCMTIHETCDFLSDLSGRTSDL